MSKKLKILFVTATYSNGGGSERVLTVLANNLPQSWDVHILEVQAFNKKKEAVKSCIHLFPYLAWHGRRTKLTTFLIRILVSHPEIIKAFRHLYGYDVVVGWMAVEGVSILPAFPESKKIAWFHNSIDNLNKTYNTSDSEYYRNKRLFSILKRSCESADSIVSVSNMSACSITSVYPEQKSKTHVIYNGTDIAELKSMSEEKIANTKLSLFYDQIVNKVPVLICVGHICKRKNFVLAVHSLKILQQKNIACNLVIVGSPFNDEDEKDLQKTIYKCNLQENVFLLGAHSNPMPFVARAKLLLMTSLDEGFPTVVTEAMALGIPFVTTPVEGASDELLDEGRCGLLSDWNAEDYATCIHRLLTDEVLYKTMSENCKEHVKKYSIENYVTSLQKLIDNIPKKCKARYKRKNIVIAVMLFIFYSAFYASYKNPKTSYVVKARFAYLRAHFSFLNLIECFYRIAIFAINILLFVPLLIYCSFLVIKYRKRLFAKTNCFKRNF